MQNAEGQIVSVVSPGTILQGKGVSEGAEVLYCKPCVSSPHCTIVMCHAPKSTYHPYVVWTYNELTGFCNSGNYYATRTEAYDRFIERTW
jgi:hypothetical protein